MRVMKSKSTVCYMYIGENFVTRGGKKPTYVLQIPNRPNRQTLLRNICREYVQPFISHANM